ncbi:MAG TPA: SDR family NAD(P)-dependent oxidoreductase [Terracidiphilus sp.]|jgi:NAD(P)-dependent dehydrogenase (short-subunit alcohol dehydrogenase family)
MERLSGKVAVVTGGCSGIGRATVLRFVEEGARVVVADIQEDEFQNILDEFTDAVRCIRCDVTSEQDIIATMQAAVDSFGRLDIVFNNAGAPGTRARVDEISAADWDFGQALLLRSAVLGTRYAAEHMKTRGGVILNMSSIAGLQVGFGSLSYSVAKAGVIHLTRVSAAELARYGIRVNAICPGLITSNIFAATVGATGAAAERINGAMRAMAPHIQPVQKEGTPLEVANTCVFLASDEAQFITGTHIVVDGGLTLGPRHAWDPATPNPVFSTLEQVLKG